MRANSWNSVNLTLDPGAVRHLDLSSWFLVTRPNFSGLQSCPLPGAWRKDWVCFSLSLLEPHPLAWIDSVVSPFLMTCSWKEREDYREAEEPETLGWINQEGVGWGEQQRKTEATDTAFRQGFHSICSNPDSSWIFKTKGASLQLTPCISSCRTHLCCSPVPNTPTLSICRFSSIGNPSSWHQIE